jgi:hypothetical protein
MTLRRLRLLLWILALSALGTSAGIAWYRWYIAQHTDTWALELDGDQPPLSNSSTRTVGSFPSMLSKATCSW